MAPVSSTPWWLDVSWVAVCGAVAALLTAATPTILRFLTGREDKGKIQLASATADQDRADARLILAYNEAIKDRDREEKAKYAAEDACRRWEKIASVYYRRAYSLYHAASGARQLADFLYRRLETAKLTDYIPPTTWEPLAEVPEDIESVIHTDKPKGE